MCKRNYEQSQLVGYNEKGQTTMINVFTNNWKNKMRSQKRWGTVKNMTDPEMVI